MIKLPEPQNTTQKILLALINSNTGVSERDFNLNSFRARISDLREHLNIKFIDRPFTNEFGHAGKFRLHWLTEEEKKKAVELYMKMKNNGD